MHTHILKQNRSNIITISLKPYHKIRPKREAISSSYHWSHIIKTGQKGCMERYFSLVEYFCMALNVLVILLLWPYFSHKHTKKHIHSFKGLTWNLYHLIFFLPRCYVINSYHSVNLQLKYHLTLPSSQYLSQEQPGYQHISLSVSASGSILEGGFHHGVKITAAYSPTGHT